MAAVCSNALASGLREESENYTWNKSTIPTGGIALAITAVKEERRKKVPLLKLVRFARSCRGGSSTGPHPIAANYTATLAVLYSARQKRKRRRIVS